MPLRPKKISAIGSAEMPEPQASAIMGVKKQLDEIEKLSAERVKSRIAQWKDRLERLFDTIDAWRREVATDYEPQKTEIPQLNEELMKKFNVPPILLPALSLLKGKERIAFVPSSLWVIGANGRVNVVTNKDQFSLVDMGGNPGQPSDWKVVSKDMRRIAIPFDREAFLKILGHQAL